jgi:hypothetical protein
VVVQGSFLERGGGEAELMVRAKWRGLGLWGLSLRLELELELVWERALCRDARCMRWRAVVPLGVRIVLVLELEERRLRFMLLIRLEGLVCGWWEAVLSILMSGWRGAAWAAVFMYVSI